MKNDLTYGTLELIKDCDTTHENPPEKCKGLFWRGSESMYISSHKSIEQRRSLRFLKRLSCSGCIHCDWLWGLIHEEMKEDYFESLDMIKHGSLYTFEYTISMEGDIDECYFQEVEEDL